MNDTKTKAASERTVTVVPMAAPLPRRKRVAHTRGLRGKDHAALRLPRRPLLQRTDPEAFEWEYAGVYATKV